MLFAILGFTLLGSVFSLIGGFFLLTRKKWNESFNLKLTSFAAGVLLATAFLDLFPHALEHLDKKINIFIPALFGMIMFFLLERFLQFHHHHEPHQGFKASAILIILGDTMHNFIDGVVIAAAFLISFPLGVSTALAVAAHEIPQEIADFSVLLSKGFSKRKTLLVNIFSSLTAIIGALLTYFAGSYIESYLPIIIAFTAGMFIYIASSDLIPELHHSRKKGEEINQALLFIFGVIVIVISTTFIGK